MSLPAPSAGRWAMSQPSAVPAFIPLPVARPPQLHHLAQLSPMHIPPRSSTPTTSAAAAKRAAPLPPSPLFRSQLFGAAATASPQHKGAAAERTLYDQRTPPVPSAEVVSPPPPLSAARVFVSPSLLGATSKRVAAVEASMPQLEAETQKSASLPASSQSSLPELQQQEQHTDGTAHVQPDETAAVDATSEDGAHASVSLPLAEPSPPSPLPPASLSPAPFEPPAPVIFQLPAATSATTPLVSPPGLQPAKPAEERCRVGVSAAERLDSSPTAALSVHSAASPALTDTPRPLEASGEGSAAVQQSTLARRPKRSLGELNGLVATNERPDESASSALSARPPPAAEVPPSPQQALAVRRGLDTALLSLASVATRAATEKESQLLQRICRGIASHDTSAALAPASAPSQHSSHDNNAAITTSAMAAESASQDDIEQVVDDEADRAAAALRRSAKPASRPNRKRFAATVEPRAMPRPGAPLIPFTPPPPPAPTQPPSMPPLSTANDASQSAVQQSQPVVPKPKPKRSIQQPLSHILPTAVHADTSCATAVASQAPLTQPSPTAVHPPPPRPPSLLTDGGSTKRRRGEAGCFYSVDRADEAEQDAAEQESDSKERKQQCALVRYEEQAGELRRLRAHSTQLTAVNKRLRSQVSALKNELRLVNEQLDRQGDLYGEREREAERTIHMTPMQLEALIDSRVSKHLHNGSRNIMEDD